MWQELRTVLLSVISATSTLCINSKLTQNTKEINSWVTCYKFNIEKEKLKWKVAGHQPDAENVFVIFKHIMCIYGKTSCYENGRKIYKVLMTIQKNTVHDIWQFMTIFCFSISRFFHDSGNLAWSTVITLDHWKYSPSTFKQFTHCISPHLTVYLFSTFSHNTVP